MPLRLALAFPRSSRSLPDDLAGNTHVIECGPLQCQADDSAWPDWVLSRDGEPGDPGSSRTLLAPWPICWRVPRQLAHQATFKASLTIVWRTD